MNLIGGEKRIYRKGEYNIEISKVMQRHGVREYGTIDGIIYRDIWLKVLDTKEKNYQLQNSTKFAKWKLI